MRPITRSPLIATALALLLAGFAMSASAQGRGKRDRQDPPPADPPRTQNDDALSDAVRRIERSNRGQVLSAERMQYDGREVSRIKVVDDDGRVRIYMDDESPAETGRPPRNNESRGADRDSGRGKRRKHDD